MCHPGCYESTNDLMVTHALGYIMDGYTLLVPMNQSVLNKSSKEHDNVLVRTDSWHTECINPIEVSESNIYVAKKIKCILRSPLFCRIWPLYLSWVTSNHFY